MIKPRFESTDLDDPDLPEGIPPVLRRAAILMREQHQQLRECRRIRTAAQHPDPGKAWSVIASELDAAAQRIEKRLEALK